MKKTISVLLIVCLLVSCLFTGCKKSDEEKIPELDTTNFDNIAPSYGSVVPLIDGPIYYYWRNYTEPGLSDTLGIKKGNVKDLYLPKDLTISWNFKQEGALYYYVDIGEKEDLSDSWRFVTPRNSADIPDLIPATTYFYKITAVTADKEIESPIYKVKTENTVRTIYIKNVSNTRDLGGWATEDGKNRMKYGIIFRGACLDKIAKSTRGRVTDVYGIKTEIDCREGAVVSPFSKTEGFNYITVCAPYYWGTSSGINATAKKYQEGLATEIRTFADPDNFPIYFHCQIGRDRTGTLALFILAICGVSKADIYKDYELYHFASVSGGDPMKITMQPNIDGLCKNLEAYDGAKSLQDGVVKFCKNELGITDAEIEAIRKNCLEPIPDGDYSSTIPLDHVQKTFTDDNRTFETKDLKTVEFNVKEGTYPNFEIFTLSDDNKDGKITYKWSDDALDGKGSLVKGNHTLTLMIRNADKDIIEEKIIKFNVI